MGSLSLGDVFLASLLGCSGALALLAVLTRLASHLGEHLGADPFAEGARGLVDRGPHGGPDLTRPQVCDKCGAVSYPDQADRPGSDTAAP